jgi:hypothetical protein
MKNRAKRGGSEGDNDKVPSTSKFHFSKGKYGNVVLAWHGVLIQKAEANFPDICAQARKILGAADVEIGKNDNQRVLNANPEVRTRVGLDSESESEGSEDERNSVINYHGNDGNNDDTDDGHGNDGNDGNDDDADDGNSHNVDQNDAGPSRSLSRSLSDFDAEKNEEVDPGPSRRGTKAWGRK